ncbi:PREDICTED: T-complex protein 1 subunit theta-like 2, partial [Myotis brandtii]|uniref:T-complex protein 1 subunit theta-like 2 n=1 Tax=Myotis brandtii TaxID=109478 RepID=UPI0007043773
FGLAHPKAPATATISSSAELVRFLKGNEQMTEKQVLQLATGNVNVAVVRGDVEERALAQADRSGIMVIQVKALRELAFLAFAQALRSLPATLAENAGLAVSQVMADMTAAHQQGHFLIGVGVEGIINVAQEAVWDTLAAKAQALRAVVDIVLQLATVDEIVVAKMSPPLQQDPGPRPTKAQEHPSSPKTPAPITR